MTWYDICVNCNCVDTRCRLYISNLHKDNI